MAGGGRGGEGRTGQAQSCAGPRGRERVTRVGRRRGERDAPAKDSGALVHERDLRHVRRAAQPREQLRRRGDACAREQDQSTPSARRLTGPGRIFTSLFRAGLHLGYPRSGEGGCHWTGFRTCWQVKQVLSQLGYSGGREGFHPKPETLKPNPKPSESEGGRLCAAAAARSVCARFNVPQGATHHISRPKPRRLAY